MGNNPVMLLAARYFKPEQEDRHNNFFEKWFYEAYIPFLASVTGLVAAGRYRLVRDNSAYPKYMQLLHFTDDKEYQKLEKSPELLAVLRAMDANFPGTDFRWWARYYLMNPENDGPSADRGYNRAEAPVVLLAAPGFESGEKKKTGDALEKWLYAACLPLMEEIPGLKAIDRYRSIGTDPDYPVYIHLHRFAHLRGYERFERNSEVIELKEKMANNFPGAEFRWWVPYRLTRSWQKSR